MRSKALQETLRELDRSGIWCFPVQTLRMAFPEEEGAFYRSMKLHEKSGLIASGSYGVWYNPNAHSLPTEPASKLVSWIRPFSTNVLSLESVLSEWGVISQMSMTTTLVTNGESHTFKTGFGRVEFVHDPRLEVSLDSGIYFDPRRELLVATPRRAYQDLVRLKRNLNLVNLDELEALPAHEADAPACSAGATS